MLVVNCLCLVSVVCYWCVLFVVGGGSCLMLVVCRVLFVVRCVLFVV